MKTYQVVRTHTSPYQSKDFLELERSLIESLGFRYELLDEAQLGFPTILLTNTHTKLRDLKPELLASTELIVHPNSGYDHFEEDMNLCAHLPVVIGHEVRAQAVAEYSLNALFQGLADLPRHLTWNKDRKWERPLVKDQKVLLFGLGHIGKIIHQTLTALGVQVTVIDPFVPGCLKTYHETDVRAHRVVIAAMGLNKTSQEIFNEEFFSLSHPELLFINGARGKLINESALREFLLVHPGAFSFLDVFPEEPFRFEWTTFPQTWKTSHIAGVTFDLDARILKFEGSVLSQFLKLSREEFKKFYHHELLQNKFHQGQLI